MNIEDCYYDECGNDIREGDLLKVYHFRHYRRRKKCYMYHIAILVEYKEKLYWQGKEYHRAENKGHYNLRAVANPDTRVILGTMVIDSKDAMRELSQTKTSTRCNKSGTTEGTANSVLDSQKK